MGKNLVGLSADFFFNDKVSELGRQDDGNLLIHCFQSDRVPKNGQIKSLQRGGGLFKGLFNGYFSDCLIELNNFFLLE